MKRLTLAIFVAATASVAAIAVDPQTGTGEIDGYRLVWQDLFDEAELNDMRWNIEDNGAGGGNNELQYYTPRRENVRIGDDGEGNSCLILTARREDYRGKKFTSGRVNSMGLVAFTHGKIEAAIKLPKTANGLWPAFWMMGNDYSSVGWPKCGETDIMEFGHADGIRTGTQDRYFNGACHWGTQWPNASYANSTTRNYSLQDGEFHIFTCIWTDQEVAMYVDLDKMPIQTPYFRMTMPQNEPNNEWSPGNYFHKLNFILFNLAIGGNFPGIHEADKITALNPENGQEASMYINYVKVYQKDGVPGNDTYFVIPGDEQPSGIPGVSNDIKYTLTTDTFSMSQPAMVEVYDLAGRQVMNANTDSMDLTALAKGLYVLRADFDNGHRLTLKIQR